MKSDLVPKEQTMPSVPGIGVGGLVMCPFGFQRSPCLKQGCELWVELTYNGGTPRERQVGRCSLAWNAILQTEMTREMERLRRALVPVEEVPRPPQPPQGGK